MTDVERILDICRQRGISKTKLAETSGVARRTIYNMIDGIEPDLDTLIKIAKALETPLAAISPSAAARIAAVA